MARGPALKPLNVAESELWELEQIVSGSSTKPKIRKRARIILECATGATNLEVAERLDTTAPTVIRWRAQYLKHRLLGLMDRPRSGRPARAEVKEPLQVTEQQRRELERWVARRTTNQALAMRARIVLGCAEGKSHRRIAEREAVSQETVIKWKIRFSARGVDGLLDEPRPGKPREIMDEDVERVITETLESTPRDATHWSTRSMAKRVGMSQTAISRIWRAFGLQPHRSETFKLSTDPLFIEKVRDIVGLYLDPPEKAVVLCVDEKSQIQALDRTQPLLPMRPGQVERRTHDYKRYGTTTLFAALNYVTGEVVGKCYKRHRTVEFRKFLDTIDKNVPKDLDVHLIIDNYGTHKTALIHKWLVKRPRFHLHFTPTSASWMNLVERWFAELTNKWLRRGSHHSTKELEEALNDYIDTWDENPRPFVWTKTADEILKNIKQFCERNNNSGH